MKTLVVFAFLASLSCAPALAADGKVSQSSLAKMGLSGMKQMTDQKGSSIRGRAVVAAPNPIVGVVLFPPVPCIGRSGR
jgi:hypothetical protein